MFTIEAYKSLWNELAEMEIDETNPMLERDLAKLNEFAEEFKSKPIKSEKNDWEVISSGIVIPSQKLIAKMEAKRTELKLKILKKLEEFEPMYLK